MIGIGIIGCGAITIYRHAPEFSSNPHSKITGYYNPDRQKAEILAARYGGKVYACCQEMLEDPLVDAVCICTPNKYHAALSIAAMEAGKHVLCEKPIATTIEEGNSMIEASERTGKILMIAHDLKFEYAHKKAKEILLSGEMGRILSFRTAFGHGGPENWSTDKSMNSWFFKKENTGSGVMGDLGIHKAHLIEWLIDDTVEEVKAFSSSRDKKLENGDFVEAYDNSICLLQTKSGIIGTLTASWTYYGGLDKSTVIYCSNGTVEIYNHPEIPLIVTKNTKEKICYSFDTQSRSGIADSFINSIINGTPPDIPGEEGLRALKVVIACTRAYEENKTAEVGG